MGSQSARRRLLQEAAGAAGEVQGLQQGRGRSKEGPRGRGRDNNRRKGRDNNRRKGRDNNRRKGKDNNRRKGKDRCTWHTEEPQVVQGSAGVETVSATGEQQGAFRTAASTTDKASQSQSQSDAGAAAGVRLSDSPPLPSSGAAAGAKDQDSHTVGTRSSESHTESSTREAQSETQGQTQGQGGTAGTPSEQGQDAEGYRSVSASGTPGAQATSRVDTPPHTASTAGDSVPGGNKLSSAASLDSTGRREGGVADGAGGERGRETARARGKRLCQRQT